MQSHTLWNFYLPFYFTFSFFRVCILSPRLTFITNEQDTKLWKAKISRRVQPITVSRQYQYSALYLNWECFRTYWEHEPSLNHNLFIHKSTDEGPLDRNNHSHEYLIFYFEQFIFWIPPSEHCSFSTWAWFLEHMS